MSDSTTHAHGQDRARINVNQDYERRDWAAKYGVTEEQLVDAVKAVGDRAADVEAYLRRTGRNAQGGEGSPAAGR